MTVTARGHGAVAVSRDTAQLHLGLEFPAAVAIDALAGAQSAQEQAMGVLLRFVDRAQISSEGLRLNPDYRAEGSGFVASHTLRVSGLAIERATELVGALATEIGDRLRLHGLELTASDTLAAVREARELAMADARERAEHLAGLAGGTLGAVVSVADGASHADSGTIRLSAATRSRGTIEGGESEVEQSVTVTWAFAPSDQAGPTDEATSAADSPT